jgi:hypothetical protein
VKYYTSCHLSRGMGELVALQIASVKWESGVVNFFDRFEMGLLDFFNRVDSVSLVNFFNRVDSVNLVNFVNRVDSVNK